MPFRVIRNDITKVKVDAIVNTVNPNAVIGNGVETAIYMAAGEDKLLAAREKLGYLKPGDVGVTPAFDLPAKWIVHASGPLWLGGERGEEETLRTCYRKSLEIASKKRCKSIAFPLMATGFYGFPKELGMKIAIESFTEFLLENEMEIILVVFGKEAYKISGDLFADVESFVDDHAVNEALRQEYYFHPTRLDDYAESSAADLSGSMSEDLPESASEDMSANALTEPIAPSALPIGSFAGQAMPNNRRDARLAARPVGKKKASLDELLKEMYTDSLEKHLQQMINKKGMKNSEVYINANISKQYFSKLMKGQVKPSKEKILALAVGMKLNMDETIDLLRLAGYALSPVSQTDVIVEYFIRQEKYNVMAIDIVLFDYGLTPLSEK